MNNIRKVSYSCFVLLSIVFAFVLSFCPLNHAFGQTDTLSGKQKKERDWKISDFIQIHGFVDTQYGHEWQLENDGTLTQSDVIMLRRARFEFSGKFHPMIDFRLQADMAFTPRLMDAWLRVKFCKYAHLWIGQIKTPYTMDNFLTPLELEFVELSQSVAALAGFVDVSGIPEYANGLEIGAMLSGTLVDYKQGDERIPILKYYAGIFGGAGINIRKDNLSKDFSARLDFYPFVKNFRLSGSVYYGNYQLYKERNAPRNRWSAGTEYLGKHWTARAEYLQGITGIAEDDPMTLDSVYLVKTRGLYAFVGYWFYMGWGSKSNVQQRIRPLFRYDYYVRDRQIPETTAHYFSFDLEWWPEEHVRVHLDYTLKRRAAYEKLGHLLAAKVSVRF
ncbi:MAG: hypothetical protein IKZ54_10070 [Bacteroidales bacterium]|nr:hypothetical protein [Bacteroidales bacterium]